MAIIKTMTNLVSSKIFNASTKKTKAFSAASILKYNSARFAIDTATLTHAAGSPLTFNPLIPSIILILAGEKEMTDDGERGDRGEGRVGESRELLRL